MTSTLGDTGILADGSAQGPQRPLPLRQLHFPSGRVVHVARSPEECESLRRTVTATAEGDDANIDVLLHGSAEHMGAVRELHGHQSAKRDVLRAKYSGIYDEIEELLLHLDHLQAELHGTAQTAHLEANFTKYGYSGHLRTKDTSPATRSPFPISLAESLQSGRATAEQLMFWKRPVLRQYFHKGLLWRSSSSGEVASFELFVDLVYVGVIAVLGDTAAEDPTGSSLLHFAITFLMGWKIWSDLLIWVEWFEIDDVFQRLSVVFYLICLLGFTINIQYGFDTTYPAMVSFYLAERFFVGSYYLWLSYLLPIARGTMLFQSASTAVGGALWICSIHVAYPYRLAPIFLALPLDLYGPSVGAFMAARRAHSFDKDHEQHRKQVAARTNCLTKWFDFYPAINIEHRVERNNAFVTLVLGANILPIIFQVRSTDPPISAFFGKAMLVLVQAFAINWLYFDIDGANLFTHAIRRGPISSIVWIASQVPFVMGLVLASGAMARLVVAHDCSNADPESLGEAYVVRSDADIPTGLRWYYAGGLGVAILSLSLIAWSHDHKMLQNARIGKHVRLTLRCIIGVVVICLSLAESLTSLGLMAVTCCLVVIILIIDIFGAHCAGAGSFWFDGFCEKQKHRCKYSCQTRTDESVSNTDQQGEKGSTSTFASKDIGLFSA